MTRTCRLTAHSSSTARSSVTELDEIFANCDYITIHVPLNADTKNTISAEAIEKMKDGVRVINLSRAASW